jgi:hypothetical protein
LGGEFHVGGDARQFLHFVERFLCHWFTPSLW